MEFVILLFVIPIVIAVLSIIAVYTLGFFGVAIFSIIGALHYSLGLNGVRTYSPNGHFRKISFVENNKNFFLGLIVIGISLTVLNYIFVFSNLKTNWYQ